MNNFIYDIPTKVYFGKDQLSNLGAELKSFGNRVLLTYGGGSIKRMGLYDKVVEEIRKAGLELFELSGIEPNPRIGSVREGVRICKTEKIDVVLAVGGGSTLDAAKFMCAGAHVDHDPWEFFGANAKPIETALPLVTILTLSATGSEMDTAGVISNPETEDKLGRLAGPIRPRVSFLDPTLTYSVNAYQTACGSADILSHLMEVYFDTEQGMDMIDGFMEGMLRAVIKYAPIAIAEPDNYEARANLMWASSWAINGFIACGRQCDWSCHPMEHELSATYDITHGLGLAILTPRWLEYCLDEVRLPRYVQFGVNVFGIDKNLEPMEIAKESIKRLSDFFFKDLGLKSNFTEIGIKAEDFAMMAAKACRDGNINGFKTLSAADVEKIYEMCL
jgi:alcohol dehydrogenase YqhD (iron-dependent ADH family)